MELPKIRCPRCHRIMLEGYVLLLRVLCPRCGYDYRVTTISDMPCEMLAYLTEQTNPAIALVQTHP